MTHKRCNKCSEEKPLSAFSACKASADGKQSRCEMCQAAYMRERYAANPEKSKEAHRKYCAANREKVRKTCHKWRVANPEKVSKGMRKYRAANREKFREASRKYREANPEKTKETNRKWSAANPDYHKERLKTDPQYRLAYLLRIRLNGALKNNQKTGSAVRDLGCTIPALQAHLEARFRPGMNWKNQGRRKGQRCWEIDHIKPLASFDLTDRKQLLEAVHFSNLQPLWAVENRCKGARVSA